MAFPGISGVAQAAGAAAGGAKTGFGSALGLASLATPYGWASAGLQLLGGSGLFGKTKVDNSTSAAYSGIGGFNLTVAPEYHKAAIDLENPIHILVLGGLIIGGIWAWKRYK